MTFHLTKKQVEAQRMLGSGASHVMFEGGSRSGKTFSLTRATVARAIKAPKSRHAILRLRFNHIMASIVLDTFPKVMELAFPKADYHLNKTNWYARFQNDSEIWFGGLDDKERTEKILGQEHATIYLNEGSQIPYDSRNLATTRLAQRVMQKIEGVPDQLLPLREYVDCNPVSKAHWLYKLYHEHVDPEGKQLPDGGLYQYLLMNPEDNEENISPEYLQKLRGLPARLQKRFLRGEWADATPGQLFDDVTIDKWRVLDGRVPDLVRVVIGVDPSGAGDDNPDHDAIGIVVVGLGTDGNAYVLEDVTIHAGPAVWGRVVATAYDRQRADAVVGEENYGGAMVQHVIKVAKPRATYKKVHATRGKAIRAEPLSLLYDEGKIRHVGEFTELEDELTSFTNHGYIGTGSPNRADALVWAIYELFPSLAAEMKVKEKWTEASRQAGGGSGQGWMG